MIQLEQMSITAQSAPRQTGIKKPPPRQGPWIVLPGDGSRQPRALLFHSLVLYGFQPWGFRLPGWRSLLNLNWHHDPRLDDQLLLLLKQQVLSVAA